LTDHWEGSQQSSDVSTPDNELDRQINRWLVLTGADLTADNIKGLLSGSVDDLDVISVVAGAASSDDHSNDFWERQKKSTLSLAWLSKAIGEVVVDHAIPLNILTRGVANIDPAVKPQPANHCFVGAAAVVQKEYRTIHTKVLDLGGDVASALTQPMLSQLLVSQLHEPLLALDRGNWWKQNYDRVSLAADTTALPVNLKISKSYYWLGMYFRRKTNGIRF